MMLTCQAAGVASFHHPRSFADPAPFFILGASGDADPQHCCPTLIKGLSVEVVVTDDRARRLFPQITPMDYETAVARALASLDQ